METIYENPNFISVCEFIQNHLYFVTVQNINNGGSCDAIIPHTEDVHFFSTDNELVYHNFYGDFGPLSINCTYGGNPAGLYKFCKKLSNKLGTYAGDAFYEKFTNSRFGRKDIADKLREKFIKNKVVVYYTSTNNEKRANAAFLMAAFAVLYLGFSPRMAYKALQPNKMRYRPFQDASVGLSPYKINMKDCLDALHKASVFGFFNFNDFNVAECVYYENIEHGDLNWIIPQKFIAFPGPVEEKNDYYHHPNAYIEYFLCNNVTDIVRLNQRAYDPKCFTMFNIRHHDLYMQDGTDPPESILKSFMNVAETASGAIAVHCKAGLGRTGTLIGAYLLKHYRMTAKEAIAWIRICRPGSVIGHQQTWLENHEEVLWYEGNEWRFKVYGKTEIVPFLPYGIYSYDSPKKEFPGLKELLANLTKSSRYRFIVKNKSKKSKTKLHQTIKHILERGKNINEKNVKSKPELEIPPVEAHESYLSQITQNSGLEDKPAEQKNLQYLKAPAAEPTGQPYNYEYSQYEYRKPFPARDTFNNEYAAPPTYQKTMEYLPPNFPSYSNAYDGKLQAMYSNPNAFYSNYSESEYSHYTYDKKFEQTPLRMGGQQNMSKVYSQQVMPERLDKQNLLSKSIDKNWKLNKTGPKCCGLDDFDKNHHTKTTLHSRPKPQEEVCAFDTRVDTISQYSRFNKPYLARSYGADRPQMSTFIDGDFYNESKIKGYDYSTSPGRSPNGFLLSPEDLQTWVETFDEKVDGSQKDKQFTFNRPSVR